MHAGADASAFLCLEEIDHILSSKVKVRETVILDCRSKWDFGEVTVLKMDGLDEFDVELLWFGELKFICRIKVNSCSKTSVEVADSVGDAGVGMEEVRRKFEKKILAKYSVRDEVPSGIVNQLMDAASYTWESELVVMFKEPPHGEESTGCFLTIVDAIGRRRDSRYCTDMGEIETFEVLLTSTKTERGDWHWVSCKFQQRSDAVGATGVPITEGLRSKGSLVVVSVVVGLEAMRVDVWFTGAVATGRISFGTTEVLVVLVTEEFERHRVVTVGVVTVVAAIGQDLFVMVFVVVIVAVACSWNIDNEVGLSCIPGIHACSVFSVIVRLTFVVRWSRVSL